MYAIKGECDYSSQQRKIGGEYEHIGEVLREICISNSYDAQASRICIFPLYVEDASCLINVDDGVGMDTAPLTKEDLRGCNGCALSSLASYFHIGHSTKKRGNEIGQFCMGSNLALAQADVLFALVTRTRQMPAGKYWVVVQARMNAAFAERANEVVSKLMAAEEARDAVLDALQEQSETMCTAWTGWVRKAFASLGEGGTLQLFVSKNTDLHRKRLLDVGERAWNEPARNKKKCKMISHPVHATSLYTYLRFQTRHGSMLAFPGQRCKLRQTGAFADVYQRDTHRAEVAIYCDSAPDGVEVPFGFPYIQYGHGENPPYSEDCLRAGSRIESHTSLWARLGPIEFTRVSATGTTPVAVFVAMDSYNIKMEQYEGLGRSGHPRSGVGMCKMQGVVLATHGVYVTTLRGDAAERLLCALPTENSDLQPETKDALLAWNEKKNMQNLMIIVDGIFEMKTDRNSITPAEMQRLLTEPRFLTGLANALEDFKNGASTHSKNFRQMLDFMDRTKKGDAEKDILEYCTKRAQHTLESGHIQIVPRAEAPSCVRDILDVAREAHALPGKGHEHSLVHLFGHYGAVARAVDRALRSRAVQGDLSRFRELLRLWMRVGLLFNGQGVDAQMFEWGVEHDRACFGAGILNTARQMQQFEFKIELEAAFNHPFVACDCIVVGSVREELVKVWDSHNNSASVKRPDPGDPLCGVGFYLTDIKNGARYVKSRVDRGKDLHIPVLIFPRLVRETFAQFADVQIAEPRAIFPRAKATKR